MSTEKTPISREDAAKLARQLLDEGKSYGDIASELRRAGYVSAKTGNALSEGGAYNLIHQRDQRKAAAQRQRRAAPRGDRSWTLAELIHLISEADRTPGYKMEAIKFLTSLLI